MIKKLIFLVARRKAKKPKLEIAKPVEFCLEEGVDKKKNKAVINVVNIQILLTKSDFVEFV